MSIRIPIISTFDYRGIRQAEKGVSSFSSKMLKTGGIITGVFAALTAAVALPVKALFDLGKAFDDAFDRIRIGTGETGQVLAGLEQSFRNVVGDSPSSFEDVSFAIADLNTRLGVTGPELEMLADQFTTLSRITGEDLAGIIENTTRLFNRANVPIEEQSGLLDMMFRASQKSGVAVADLAQQMDEYRTTFEEAGFSVSDQLAMLALFGREGVQTERIIGAMSIAQRKFANENVDLTTGMQNLIEEIRSVDEQLAYSKGAEYFGRSSIEMVNAIRSGRLSYEEMAAAIMSGDNSIMAIAEETDDLSEAWDRFKNYLRIEFEPAATEVFDALTTIVDEELIPAAERIKTAYQNAGIEGAIDQIGREWDAIYTKYIEPFWESKVKPFFENVVKPGLEELGEEIGRAVGKALADAVSLETESRLRRWAMTVSIPRILQPFKDRIIAFLDFTRILNEAKDKAEASVGAPGAGGGGGGGTGVARVGPGGVRTMGGLAGPVSAEDIGAGPRSVVVSDGAVVLNLTVQGSKSPQEVGRVVADTMDDAIARLARELAVS